MAAPAFRPGAVDVQVEAHTPGFEDRIGCMLDGGVGNGEKGGVAGPPAGGDAEGEDELRPPRIDEVEAVHLDGSGFAADFEAAGTVRLRIGNADIVPDFGVCVMAPEDSGLSRFFGIIDQDFLKDGSWSLFSRLNTFE